MKHKALAVYLILFSCVFSPLLAGFTPAAAADGTTGEIDYDTQIVTDGTTMFVVFKKLTVSADYLVNWTGDNTGVSFTTGASETKHTVKINADKPAATDQFHIYLRYQSAGTLIDQKTLTIAEADELVNTDQFMAIVVPFIILFVIAGIIMYFRYRR